MSIALDILRPSSATWQRDDSVVGVLDEKNSILSRPTTAPNIVSRHIVESANEFRPKSQQARSSKKKRAARYKIITHQTSLHIADKEAPVLPLPDFQKKVPVKEDEEMGTLYNYHWDNPKDPKSKSLPVGILRATPSLRNRVNITNEEEKWDRLTRRVSFHSVRPRTFSVKHTPTKPPKPSIVLRLPNEFKVRWKLPKLFTNKAEGDSGDEESDESDQETRKEWKEPKRVGFEFHVASSYRDLKGGVGIRRTFSTQYSPVILVKDIRPDARYFVRVRTQYMMGFSEFSNILTIPKFKARAPSDPILKIKKYPQTITIAYDFNGVGTDGNKKIIEHSFVVRDKQSGQEVFELRGNPGQAENQNERTGNIVVAHLDDRKSYVVEARAKNEIGWGKYKVQSVRTPTLDGPLLPWILGIQDVSSNGFVLLVRSSLGPTQLPITKFQVMVSYNGGISTAARFDFPVLQTEKMADHTLNIEKGVLPSRNVSVQVRARNKVSYSNPSKPVQVKTKAALRPVYPSDSPIVATLVTTPNLGTFTVSLEWTAPDAFGDTLIHQELKAIESHVKGPCNRINKDIFLKCEGDQTTATIDDLWPRTAYTFQIRGLSNAGYGEWSTGVSITTPPLSIKNMSVHFYWEGPWMKMPGWYEGNIIGVKDESWYVIKSIDYPESVILCPKHKISWFQDSCLRHPPPRNPYEKVHSNIPENGVVVDMFGSSDEGENDNTSAEENSEDEAFDTMKHTNFAVMDDSFRKIVRPSTLVHALTETSKRNKMNLFPTPQRLSKKKNRAKRGQKNNIGNWWFTKKM
jgi:hypothetical protein